MESLSDAKIMLDIEVFMKQYLYKEYPNMTPPEEILVKSILSFIPPRNEKNFSHNRCLAGTRIHTSEEPTPSRQWSLWNWMQQKS